MNFKNYILTFSQKSVERNTVDSNLPLHTVFFEQSF